MSSYIDRENCKILLRVVDPVTGLQSGDTIEYPFVLTDADLTVSLPLEVALCLSYGSESVPGVPIRSRRGRLYLGPFNTGVLADDEDDRPTPTEALQLNVGQFGAFVSGSTLGVPYPWSVWSRTRGELYPIVGGYVDNEWDTQRRRGGDPSGRLIWGPIDPTP